MRINRGENCGAFPFGWKSRRLTGVKSFQLENGANEFQARQGTPAPKKKAIRGST